MQEIQYTEVLIRRWTRYSMARSLGPLYLIAMLLLASSIGFSIVRGSHDWFFGATATVFALGTVVPLGVLRRHVQAALGRLHELDNGKLSIDILAARLHMTSAMGNTDIPLARVTQLKRYPSFWVLMTGKTSLMTLPITTIPIAVQQRWLLEFQAVGTKI